MKEAHSKLFFRQTLDPKIDRNSIVTKMFPITPNNLEKKLMEKDNSMSNLEKKYLAKNEAKANITQQGVAQSGSFWRKKAVSPPSKQLSPSRPPEPENHK